MALPKLYQYAVCPFCWKIRSALALKGADFETIEVHPLNKKELEFSDYKKVPIYVDSKGQQINDSTPIMRHIDKELGGDPLFETQPEARELEERLLGWSEAYVRSIPPLIYDTLPHALKAFDYISKTGNFSWHQRTLIKFSGAAVMVMVANRSRKKQGIKDPARHFERLLDEWVKNLEGREYAGGEKPNAADASVFGITMSVSGLPAAKFVRDNGAFRNWLSRMEAKTSLSFVCP
jgi:microsomal prostaglandin-E synthase 2